MKIPFILGSNTGRSTNINAQRTINLFPAVDPNEAKEQVTLYGTPGHNLFSEMDDQYANGSLAVALASAIGNTFVVDDQTFTFRAQGTYATGTITVASAPALNETFTVDTQTFIIMASGVSKGNVVQNANTSTQANNIATSINRDITTVTAVANTNVVTITAKIMGTAGNAIILRGTVSTMLASAATLTGGTATSLSTGDVPLYDEDKKVQAAAIATAINRDLATVTAVSAGNLVYITAVAEGSSGTSIVLTGNSTKLVASGYGTLEMIDTDYTSIRAFHIMEDLLYAVSGKYVYEISLVDGVAEIIRARGNLKTSTGNLYLSSNVREDGSQMLITDGSDTAYYLTSKTSATGTLTVARQAVANTTFQVGSQTFTFSGVYASGTLTVNAAVSLNQTFQIGYQSFTFKASFATTGDVVLSSDTSAQAMYISTAINRDLSYVRAEYAGNIVTVTAKDIGASGNSIALTSAASNLIVTGIGTLAGGVDPEDLAGTVGISSDETIQAENITAAINRDSTTVLASSIDNVVTITAVTSGTAGNSIILTGTALTLVASGYGTLLTGSDTPILTPLEVEDFSASSCTYQDGYTLISRKDTNEFYVPEYLNDVRTWNSTRMTYADSNPEPILRIMSSNREVWVFKHSAIEPYYNSANTDFPFERIQGGVMEVGTAAAASIARISGVFYWLSDTLRVVRNQGYQAQVISTPTLEYQISTYDTVDDAIGYTCLIEGHEWYVLAFPTEKKTWVYDTTTGFWFEWESYVRGPV